MPKSLDLPEKVDVLVESPRPIVTDHASFHQYMKPRRSLALSPEDAAKSDLRENFKDVAITKKLETIIFRLRALMLT